MTLLVDNINIDELISAGIGTILSFQCLLRIRSVSEKFVIA